MRKTALVQLSLALILAITAGFIILKWMNARTQPQAKAETRTMVIVAAKDIKRGARLTSEHMTKAPFLTATLPPGALTTTDKLRDRVVETSLTKGEPITLAKLLDQGAPYAGVSTMIAPGKRAVAVKGNKVLGLAGFIRPGNHVDVLVTIDVRKKDKDVPMTKTVLEDVRVIATGTELSVDGDDGTTSSVDTYTLELTSPESEMLALAATKGTLHFALRNPTDTTTVKTRGADVNRLLSSLSPSPAKSRAKTSSTRVEIITGTSRKTMRFTSHADTP